MLTTTAPSSKFVTGMQERGQVVDETKWLFQTRYKTSGGPHTHYVIFLGKALDLDKFPRFCNNKSYSSCDTLMQDLDASNHTGSPAKSAAAKSAAAASAARSPNSWHAISSNSAASKKRVHSVMEPAPPASPSPNRLHQLHSKRGRSPGALASSASDSAQLVARERALEEKRLALDSMEEVHAAKAAQLVARERALEEKRLALMAATPGASEEDGWKKQKEQLERDVLLLDLKLTVQSGRVQHLEQEVTKEEKRADRAQADLDKVMRHALQEVVSGNGVIGVLRFLDDIFDGKVSEAVSAPEYVRSGKSRKSVMHLLDKCLNLRTENRSREPRGQSIHKLFTGSVLAGRDLEKLFCVLVVDSAGKLQMQK
jgi:hypothetical protein